MKLNPFPSRLLAATAAILSVHLGSSGTSLAALTVVTGLQLHFDAGSITPVADGTSVSTWADSSGNGRDITGLVGTSPTAPTYQSAAIGGLPAVRFSGGGGLISSFGSNTFSGDANTVFTVFRSTSTDLGTIASLNGTAENQIFLYLNRYNTTMPVATGGIFASFDGSSSDQGSSNDLNGPYNDGGGHLFTTYADNNIAYLRGDGGTETNSYTDTIRTTDIDGITLGSLNNGNDQRINGDIAEILVYNRVLTPTEIASVESHLLGKYSIVPEPSAALLSVLGLGFALARRRR